MYKKLGLMFPVHEERASREYSSQDPESSYKFISDHSYNILPADSTEIRTSKSNQSQS